MTRIISLLFKYISKNHFKNISELYLKLLTDIRRNKGKLKGHLDFTFKFENTNLIFFRYSKR